MYNEHIIDEMKEFLNKELEQTNSELTGEVDYIQGFLLGRLNVIKYVLGIIDIGKTDEKK